MSKPFRWGFFLFLFIIAGFLFSRTKSPTTSVILENSRPLKESFLLSDNSENIQKDFGENELYRKFLRDVIPLDLQSRAEIRQNTESSTGHFSLFVDGRIVQYASAREKESGTLETDFPPFPNQLAPFPEVNLERAKATILDAFKGSVSEIGNIRYLKASWLPELGDWTPCLEFQVDSQDQNGNSSKELWCVDARTFEVHSKLERVHPIIHE